MTMFASLEVILLLSYHTDHLLTEFVSFGDYKYATNSQLV